MFHYDQLVDVARSMNEWLGHVARAVPRLDDLLPDIQVYHGGVVIARIRDGWETGGSAPGTSWMFP